MLILFFLTNAAWALGPSKIGPLLEFSGQGIPRESLEDCHSAGIKLAAQLTKKGFKSTTTDCIGTSAEIGGLVPTLLARIADRYKTEQSMNGPLPDAAACDKALKVLVASARGDVLEAECLTGNELDLQGKKTGYFQPWITTLTKIDNQPQPHAKSVEPDLRGNKAVSATPDLESTTKTPPSNDGKTQAK